MNDVDDDLRDVFHALYAGDEWEDWADDDRDAGVAVTRAETDRRSRAYLRAAIASLLTPPPDPPTPATKRRRIYATPAPSPGLFIPSTAPLPPADVAAYAPFSPLPLLARLRTFTPRTYSPLLPPCLSPGALALAGWVNNAKDGVVCASSVGACGGGGNGSGDASGNGKKGGRGSLGCSAAWGVGGLESLDARIRAEVVRRLAASLSSRHEPGCGWRVLPSPPALLSGLQRYVHPLVSSSLYPLARAVQVRSLGPLRPRWVSPLSEQQLAALGAALKRFSATDHTSVLSEFDFEPLALALAFFGWYPYDPAHPQSADHVAPSTAPGSASATDIVACRLCRRRVGLWMFAKSTDSAESESMESPESAAAQGKTLDVHKEHLWWCPLGADGWWADCALLVPSEKHDTFADVPRLGLERPGKRWKKWVRSKDTSAQGPAGSSTAAATTSTSASTSASTATVASAVAGSTPITA